MNPGHLRTATRKQNNENRDGARTSNISGTRGVQWVERNQKWRVTVGHYGKNIHVGMFTDLAEAEAAAISKRNELHTHNDTDRIAA